MAKIDDLSDAILSEILSYIDILERQQLEIVCKRWQSIIRRFWTTQHILRITAEQPDYVSDPVNKIYYIPGGIACHLECWTIMRTILKSCAGNIVELHMVLGTDNEDTRPEDTFESLIQNKNLKSFSIVDGLCDVLSDICTNLPTDSLQEFSVWNYYEEFSETSIDVIEDVLSKTPPLTSLAVGEVSLLILKKIEKMSGLKSLKLGPLDCTVERDDLHFNTILLSDLEEFVSWDKAFVDDKFLTELVENCKKLRAIRFRSTSVTIDGLKTISKLPNLRCVNMTTVGPEVLNYFSNLEDFRCDLTGHGPIPEEALTEFLRRSPNLKICYFSDESLHRSFKEIAARFGTEIQYQPYWVEL